MSADQTEDKIDQAARQFAAQLCSLSDDAYFREAFAKYGIRSVVWAILHEMPETKSALLQQLETMQMVVADYEESDEEDD